MRQKCHFISCKFCTITPLKNCLQFLYLLRKGFKYLKIMPFKFHTKNFETLGSLLRKLLVLRLGKRSPPHANEASWLNPSFQCSKLSFNTEFDHKAALCKGLLFFHEHAILLKEISWIEGTSQLTKVYLSQMDNPMLPAYVVSSSAQNHTIFQILPGQEHKGT